MFFKHNATVHLMECNKEVGFRKVRWTRDQIASIHWIIEKAREFQKKFYFCFIDCVRAFNWVDDHQLFSSVCCSVVSDSFRPGGQQHTRPPCPSPTSGVAHWVSYAMQPSHPLSSPFPPTFKLFQHQGLFKWVSYSHQVAKLLELQLQHQSFQWIFNTDFL